MTHALLSERPDIEIDDPAIQVVAYAVKEDLAKEYGSTLARAAARAVKFHLFRLAPFGQHERRAAEQMLRTAKAAYEARIKDREGQGLQITIDEREAAWDLAVNQVLHALNHIQNDHQAIIEANRVADYLEDHLKNPHWRTTRGLSEDIGKILRAVVNSFKATALAPWKPTHRHADGGVYRELGPIMIKHPDSGEWLEGILYDNAKGTRCATATTRWRDRFVRLFQGNAT